MEVKTETQHSHCLMVQGTSSDAGKSVAVTALCRLLHREGVCVAPFKPQNMALNAAVTVDGGEIGRAQALQAKAAGVDCHSDFNPVLLKPSSNTGAQVIIHGKALSAMEARQYHDYKPRAMAAVLESWTRLQQSYDCILVEGAGSPAEINLRDGDIANMGFAEAVDCPVILIADIDRGGVFAQLVGTLALLSESEQARIKGFVINRFRGDIALLQGGLDWLEERTGIPVLGVIPFVEGLELSAEDAITSNSDAQSERRLRVAVPLLPRISNHTDFDPLRIHPEVEFAFIPPGKSLGSRDLIVLPGSKNVRADLAFLRAQGWDREIYSHLRYGGKLIGICGGLQMLGTRIDDPEGIEDIAGSSVGLALLDFHTRLHADKQLRRVSGESWMATPVRGYEIHAGRSEGPALQRPFADLSSHRDGARSADGAILGSYIHGLFDEAETLAGLLRWAGLEQAQGLDIDSHLESEIDRIADTWRDHIDMEQVLSILQRNT